MDLRSRYRYSNSYLSTNHSWATCIHGCALVLSTRVNSWGFPGRSKGNSLGIPCRVLWKSSWWSDKKEEKRMVLLWRKGRSDIILWWAITPGLLEWETSSWSGLDHMQPCDCWSMWVHGYPSVFGSAKSMFITKSNFRGVFANLFHLAKKVSCLAILDHSLQAFIHS